MRILPADQIRFAPDDVVFRQSVQAPLLAAVGSLIAALGLCAAAWGEMLPWPLAALAVSFFLLFGALAAATLRRALSPDNWLLASNGHRMLVSLRSYLNASLPEAPHVLELPLTELEAVRETRLEMKGRDRLNDRADHTVVFLDLQLREGVDLAPLEERLRRERQLRARGTTWLHYPVTVAGESTVRIEWRSKHTRTVPGITVALQLLGRGIRVDPGAREHVDLGAVRRRPESEEALRQVRALAVQGRVLEATLLAERAFGWSTTEAKQRVELLAGQGD